MVLLTISDNLKNAMNLTLSDIISVTFLVGVLQFLSTKWLEARLTASITHEYDKKLEDYRGKIKRREQAARVAKLLAMQFNPNASTAEFNELAWELSLWLPPDLVRELTSCLCSAPNAKQPKEILIAIRKQLLDKPDDLLAEQIVHRTTA